MLISEYNHANSKANNKSFYSHLLHDLGKRNITEDAFIISLCGDITENLDLESFARKLKNRLTKEV